MLFRSHRIVLFLVGVVAFVPFLSVLDGHGDAVIFGVDFSTDFSCFGEIELKNDIVEVISPSILDDFITFR